MYVCIHEYIYMSVCVCCARITWGKLVCKRDAEGMQAADVC